MAGFDPAALRRLINLAGPDLAGELQRRLIADLTGVAQNLTDQPGDCARVQAQCHVLIALAGTAGASGLQALAEDLHQMALERNAPAMAGLLPEVLRQTHDLIGDVAAVRP